MWHREGEGEEFGNETRVCIPSYTLVWYGEEGRVGMRLVCMYGTVS